MAQFRILQLLLGAVAILVTASAVQAAKPGASLLPQTTNAFVSVPDVQLLRQRWDTTQLGQLAQDPAMKPFLEDLRQQLQAKLGRTEVRLSIKLEDLEGVPGGEVCLATLQPSRDEKLHALAMVVDITEHAPQAEELLAKVDKDLLDQGAKRTKRETDGVSVTTYELPRKPGEVVAQRAVYFVHDDTLVATDHQATALEILKLLTGTATESLADVVAFQQIRARCLEKAGESNSPEAHASWFVEPFAYIQTMRAATGGRQRRGTDMLKVLMGQGFSAIKGIGGMVWLAEQDQEVTHRSYIYAPSVVEGGERYKLAARMLNFPNGKDLAPEKWVPHDVTNYIAFQWEMQKAFEYSKTLVDEVAGAPVFEDILESLKQDPNGPQVDLRQGLVRHLGKRATFFTNYRLPVTTTSERWMLGLQITNAAEVIRTLDKAMAADPDAKKRVLGDHTIWEIVSTPQEEDDVVELDIASTGFGDFAEEEEEEERAPMLMHAAFTVSNSYLLVASHFDYMEEVLIRGAEGRTLAGTKDFVMVDNALGKLGADQTSFRTFIRTDKAYHSTFELIRQGKMPESESLFGNMLNRLLGPEEEGVVREQEIQGDKLPDFETVRGYLGPAGMYVQSEENGWYVAGCILKRPDDGMEAAGPLVSRRTSVPR